VVGKYALSQVADVLKYDPGPKRACWSTAKREWTSSSSGFVSVIQEDDANHFRKLEDFPVQKLVHSLAVDTATHSVYAPEQEKDGKPVARIVIYERVTRATQNR
jgi:hypothetical protein